MSNFDFLKNFDKELYEICIKLEDDVIESPRAVTADATQFLEKLIRELYKLSNNKLDKNFISFYKKIDNLYRLGGISYIYKNKLKEAYTLRSKIHNTLTPDEEKQLAFDLHQRLFYISKKYFQDYCENKRLIHIPQYKKPELNEIKFKNCIICGFENSNAFSNICDNCNKKIEYGNFIISFKNKHEKETFTRNDLIKSGLSESESILLLFNLSKENVVINNGDNYVFNEDILKLLLNDMKEYIEISSLVTKFYNNEITSKEIKFTELYAKGKNNQNHYCEFYRLVNEKIENDFEKDLLKYKNIEKAIKNNFMDSLSMENWFNVQKLEFAKGTINEAFILYNEILINEFFKLKRKGFTQKKIFNQLNISEKEYSFWKDEFMGKDFLKIINNIKKEIIITKIRNNKTLTESLKASGISHQEFDELYQHSKNTHDSFYENFNKEYIQKRRKLFVKHLKDHDLNSTIRLTKITKNEFLKWYNETKKDYSDFYLKTTEILMNKFLILREKGWNKKDILKHIGISKEIYESWNQHDGLDIYVNFKEKNKEITSNIIKKGKLINALKDGKSKEEAISAANLTVKDFLELYENSEKEKTDFHVRFDEEYIENRKTLFSEIIQNNDFFNAIDKCEISQIEFNKWYLIDQNKYLSNRELTDFYLKTSQKLMDNYIQARYEGKNKPDAARIAGLSNIIIDKWLNHTELNLYAEFAEKENQLTIDLIEMGFRDYKSKSEISEI